MLESVFWILFFLIFYTYLGYLPILYAAALLWGAKPPSPGKVFKISVVISAYNEEKVIASRVENLLGMDYPAGLCEIIIGSDGSSDATAEIAAGFRDPRVRVIKFEERRGKISVLNDLVKLASGDILVFSDANTLFEKDALKFLVSDFVDEKTGCVCGRLVLKDHEKGVGGEYEGVYWAYESLLKKLEGRLGVTLGANGAIYAVRRHLYGGLPGGLIVEDFVLPMTILEKGFKVTYDERALAYEETSASIKDESTRKTRIGAGNFQSLFFLLGMLSPLRGLAFWAYFSHKVIRWLVPFMLMAVLILNFVLYNSGPIYKALFALQCVFYSLALIRMAVGNSLKLFNPVYYFCAMNFSLLAGFVRFISGGQKVTWQRVER